LRADTLPAAEICSRMKSTVVWRDDIFVLSSTVAERILAH
jgi:hypothetical protein